MMDEKRSIDPEHWVDEHGDVLYRYALSRLGDPTKAEDVVQETLYSALKSYDQYAGKSTLRTWLVGILRHKIFDLIRKDSREKPYEDLESTDSIEPYFDKKGHWRTFPLDWQVNPGKAYERVEFWAVFQKCLFGLQDRFREVFTLRELEDKDADEICKTMGISSTNLWVMLYRARMQLRSCLEKNWFQSG